MSEKCRTSHSFQIIFFFVEMYMTLRTSVLARTHASNVALVIGKVILVEAYDVPLEMNEMCPTTWTRGLPRSLEAVCL